MFSVSPAELFTIAIVVLVVFGPERLPEIARKAGRILRDLRAAAQDLRAGLEQEYQETLEPLDRARRELSTGADTPPAEPGGEGSAEGKPPHHD